MSFYEQLPGRRMGTGIRRDDVGLQVALCFAASVLFGAAVGFGVLSPLISIAVKFFHRGA